MLLLNTHPSDQMTTSYALLAICVIPLVIITMFALLDITPSMEHVKLVRLTMDAFKAERRTQPAQLPLFDELSLLLGTLFAESFMKESS